MQQPPIDISLTQWQTISNILQKHIPQYPVWAFGSRAKWKAKPFSDLDLAIITEQPMNWGVSATLVEDFLESDLPFKVDIVDWAATTKAFCKIIAENKIILQNGIVDFYSSGIAGTSVSLKLGSVSTFFYPSRNSLPANSKDTL